jgi:formamidopyrimidine-DNA glycosylase
MPELPEVETIRRDLQKAVVGKKIVAVEARVKKMVAPRNFS